MKRYVKITVAVLCAALTAAAAVYTTVRPLSVETVTLTPQTVSLTFTETGSYEYGRVYSVYPLVSGEILEVLVRKGDHVSAGDVIAVVSAADYEYQILQLNSMIAGYNGQINHLRLQEQQEKMSLDATLQTLEGQLAALNAEMEQNRRVSDSLETQINIQEQVVAANWSSVRYARDYLKEMRDYGDDYEIILARQALANAQNSLAQNELILEQLQVGDIPDNTFEVQKQAIEGQIAVITQQQGQNYTGGMVQYYNSQITAAQHSIAQMNEMAGKASVTAPVNGVIYSLPVEDQNVLSQQALVATIGDAPCVEVYVPIREIDGISIGDSVELIRDTRLGGETITGIIFDIEEEAQVKVSALGVEERKVRVLVRPFDSGYQIGYDMDVKFSPYTFEDVLVIPKTALFQLEGADSVWTVNDGTVQRREVEKDTETREGYIISGGLMDGDIVIVDANNDKLTTGKRITGQPQ